VPHPQPFDAFELAATLTDIVEDGQQLRPTTQVLNLRNQRLMVYDMVISTTALNCATVDRYQTGIVILSWRHGNCAFCTSGIGRPRFQVYRYRIQKFEPFSVIVRENRI
jgi:hypothetical protein